MIDTHAHLNFQAFQRDYRQIIKDNFKNGLKAVINVGSNLETNVKAVEIAEEFKDCYASVGLHPIHVRDEEFNEKKYQELITGNKKKVKAVGETGFDFYHSQKNKEEQKTLFLQHVFLADSFNLPVILHCRGSKENGEDAYLELIKTIKELKKRPCGVIHCFSSHKGIVREFLDLGFYVGFDGPITFKNADPAVLEAMRETPLEKILLETDSPYLTPEPYRGQRNQPVYVRFIAQKIGEIKGASFEQVVRQTTKNAKGLFCLD